MPEGRSGAGCLVASVVWIVILGVLAVAARYFLLPYFDDKLKEDTGTGSAYRETVTVAADSFSGYAILRSPAMADDLRARGIRLVVNDDGADYDARLKALDTGATQMAVFTVDSLLLSGAKLGRHPASIVAVLDETKGADALVAWKAGVSRIQDLDSPEARIVLTPHSPSEFLARTVIAHFNLPKLGTNWLEPADGAEAVYKKFLAANRSDKRAYALWEPYVSRALQEDGAQILLDSSRLQGYIVDVLVAERRFLRDHPDTARAVVEAYFRAAHRCLIKPDSVPELLMDDAKRLGGDTLTADQAKRMASGIAWKNTLDNYAIFGIERASGTLLLEDILANVADVLVKTDAVKDNPVIAAPGSFYYATILSTMRANGFHPARGVDIIKDADAGEPAETVTVAEKLPALSDAEWKALLPVGSMRVSPIVFARGTARLNVQSQRDLETLAKTLATWPRYYLVIRGHSRAEGDRDANLALARSRAQAALDTLKQAQVDENRLSFDAQISNEDDASGQSVSFELLQKPY